LQIGIQKEILLSVSHERHKKFEAMKLLRGRSKINPDIRSDLDDLNFYCKSCDFAFTNVQGYGRHLRHLHNLYKTRPRGIMPNPEIAPDVEGRAIKHCASCNITYSKRGGCVRHLFEKHGIKLIRPIHGYSLKVNSDVKLDVDDPNHYCKSYKINLCFKSYYFMHLKALHNDVVLPEIPKISPNIAPDVEDPNNYCKSCDFNYKNRIRYKAHLKNKHKMKLTDR
jgi:uncharacterized C2H2 Zn-finger protein